MLPSVESLTHCGRPLRRYGLLRILRPGERCCHPARVPTALTPPSCVELLVPNSRCANPPVHLPVLTAHELPPPAAPPGAAQLSHNGICPVRTRVRDRSWVGPAVAGAMKRFCFFKIFMAIVVTVACALRIYYSARCHPAGVGGSARGTSTAGVLLAAQVAEATAEHHVRLRDNFERVLQIRGSTQHHILWALSTAYIRIKDVQGSESQQGNQYNQERVPR